MNLLMNAFVNHAYLILFCWVLVEQAGLPIPSVPVLVAAGTMSSANRLHISVVLPLVLLACFISDSAWFALGRQYGTRILSFFCRLSIEPSSCAMRTKGNLRKGGGTTMLFAKFVPGLGAMAAPLAGQSGVSYGQFAIYDLLGSLGWASIWLFGGQLFANLLARSSRVIGIAGRHAVPMVLLGLLVALLIRYVRWLAFLRELRGLRLEPHQLICMLLEAERLGAPGPYIIDLRHPLDVLADPVSLPQAFRVGPEELTQKHEMIPRDRDVVLYCTCPNEETSARVAMTLRKLGIARVRPLRGGLQAWREAGHTLIPIEVVIAA